MLQKNALPVHLFAIEVFRYLLLIEHGTAIIFYLAIKEGDLNLSCFNSAAMVGRNIRQLVGCIVLD